METFECPICLETYAVRIFQCIQGHSICETCFLKLEIDECPQCRGIFSETRNYALEEALEKSLVLNESINKYISTKKDRLNIVFNVQSGSPAFHFYPDGMCSEYLTRLHGVKKMVRYGDGKTMTRRERRRKNSALRRRLKKRDAKKREIKLSEK